MSLSLNVVEDLDSVERSKELHCLSSSGKETAPPIAMANDGRALHRHSHFVKCSRLLSRGLPVLPDLAMMHYVVCKE